MNKHSMRKEQELLRTYYVDSGALGREALGRSLGLTVHSIDQTRAAVFTVLREMGLEPVPDQGSKRVNRIPQTLNTGLILTQLYRLQTLTEKQTLRMFGIVKIVEKYELEGRLAGRKEILQELPELIPPSIWKSKNKIDAFLKHLTGNVPPAAGTDSDIKDTEDEFVLSDLQDLCRAGILRTETGSRRKTLYRLNSGLFDALPEDELFHLYDFILYRAATSAQGALGFLLAQLVGDYLLHVRGTEPWQLEVLAIPYAYYGKLLDEEAAYQLEEAIRQRRSLTIRYFSVRTGKKATTPDGDDPDLITLDAIPARIVYDGRFSRWYLVGWDPAANNFAKLRLDYIIDWTDSGVIPAGQWNELQIRTQAKLHTSWLVSTEDPIRVRVRFYYEPTSAKNDYNFILARVQQEGGECMITAEDDRSFVWELAVNGISDIKPWIMSFGSSAEVLEPPELRARIIQDWEAIAGHYDAIREDS